MATWLDYLAHGLEAREWRPVLGLVAGKHHDPDLYLREHPFDPVEIIRAPTGTVEGRVRALVRAIRRVRPDLVATANIPDVFRAVDRMRRRGDRSLRVLMTLHGLQPDYFQDIEAFRAVIDGVVCTNRLTCELAERIGGMDPSRIFYAPYGVEAQLTYEEREAGDGELRILYCGRFDQDQKRVLDLPQILCALDSKGVPSSLTLAGGGPLETDLREALTPWVETGRAHFAGGLGAGALAEEYGRADALLITSSWETGPIVAWEAMAAGVPVVSSRFLGSGLEGALVDGESSLLFPVGDAEGAAECLVRLAGSLELRDTLRKNAKKLVCERYSTSHSVGQWAGALKRVLERPPRSASQSLPPIQPQGRLDRLLGVGAAETVRHLLRRRFEHAGPGGEWPHSYGDRSNDEEFLAQARDLDRGPSANSSAAAAQTKRSYQAEAARTHDS